MIQITEFRIGNHLLVEGALQQLHCITIDTAEKGGDTLIGYVQEGATYYERVSSERVQAAPLTDSLLQQCGFTFHPYFHYWQKLNDLPGTGVDMELDRDFTAMDFAHRPLLKEIKSLHHLENLYFALKRRELPLTPAKMGDKKAWSLEAILTAEAV